MDEQQDIGYEREIIRDADGVHRPTGWWTPAVHDLLKHLEEAGFKFAPKVLGFDNQGREVLQYIKGESGAKGWLKIISDDGLIKYAKLLRSYHDAVKSYSPSYNQWIYGRLTKKSNQIICHGDFGPWNIVWQGNDPVGMIDWDMALPASPEYDILYALEYAIPFRNDEDALEWHHFKKAPDRKHRIEIFLEAYGHDPIKNLAEKVAKRQERDADFVRLLAAKHLEPQESWVRDGTISVIEARAGWTRVNRKLFEA